MKKFNWDIYTLRDNELVYEYTTPKIHKKEVFSLCDDANKCFMKSTIQHES